MFLPSHFPFWSLHVPYLLFRMTSMGDGWHPPSLQLDGNLSNVRQQQVPQWVRCTVLAPSAKSKDERERLISRHIKRQPKRFRGPGEKVLNSCSDRIPKEVKIQSFCLLANTFPIYKLGASILSEGEYQGENINCDAKKERKVLFFPSWTPAVTLCSFLGHSFFLL